MPGPKQGSYFFNKQGWFPATWPSWAEPQLATQNHGTNVRGCLGEAGVVLGMRVPCRCPRSSELPLKGGGCQWARARLRAASSSRLRQAASAPGQGSLTRRTDACRQWWWRWSGV